MISINVLRRTAKFGTKQMSTSAVKAKDKLSQVCSQTVKEIKGAGTYKNEKQIASAQGVEITVNGKKLLNFCANNYLGLSNNQDLIDLAVQTFKSRGFGMSSVRFICGTQDIHKQLEQKISEFHSKEDSIIYSSGFDANAGFFEAVLNENDAIISDTLNHASIIDGIRLSKAKRYRYKHLDMEDLEEQLKRVDDLPSNVGNASKEGTNVAPRLKMIVTDGVFSMDGDIAPLDKIVKIAERYNCNIFVDDAHASGFIGKTGRGTSELFGVTEHIDVINSTLGKALGGGSGGYTTSSSSVIDLLRQKSRPYLFSNSLVPAIAAATIKVFELLEKDSSLVGKLHDNTVLFREKMGKIGFKLMGHKDSPIVPVLLNDEKTATEFGEEMIENGIYVVGFSYPVVPKGMARIRVQLSAAHNRDHILKAVETFEKIGRKKSLI